MATQGLLFIPDISGFTRFVNETEIQHSRLIIKELLEAVINANEIGLEISEIEGDAILFYKFGELPELAELYRQVESMFCAFHRNIVAYELRRYCQCKACMAAVELTLKVITHYGEFTGYNVKSFNKLIGKDIIVAHELLKNDIEHHEYWLVTQSLLQGGPPGGLASWIQWNPGAKRTQGGEVAFQYTALSQLKAAVSAEPLPQAELSRRVRMISASREYETDIITLFHATGDFQYRGRWREGVQRVEELDHLLPRVGMRCRCVLDKGEVVIYSNSYKFNSDRIEFSETDEEQRGVTYYILEKVAEKRTRFTLEYYLPPDPLTQLRFRLSSKRSMERSLEKSLQNLVELAKQIRLPANVEAV
jgi:hypothetical protein